MENLKKGKQWGVGGVILIFIASIVGIWGGFEATRFNEGFVGILDLISNTLGILGTIALIVSTYFYGKALNRPEIFKNFLFGIILQIVAEGVIVVGFLSSIFPTGIGFSVISLGLILIGYVLWVFSVYLFKKSFVALGESLNYSLFKLAGNLVFWGGVLSIFVVGLFIMFVGWILALIGFLRAPVEELPKSS